MPLLVWEILALLVMLALAVLGVYGGLIKRNYDGVNRLKQRLFGSDDDDTEDGFLVETNDRIDSLEQSVQSHAEHTHRQLYALDQKVTLVVDAVIEIHDDDLDADEFFPDQPSENVRLIEYPNEFDSRADGGQRESS